MTNIRGGGEIETLLTRHNTMVLVKFRVPGPYGEKMTILMGKNSDWEGQHHLWDYGPFFPDWNGPF